MSKNMNRIIAATLGMLLICVHVIPVLADEIEITSQDDQAVFEEVEVASSIETEEETTSTSGSQEDAGEDSVPTTDQETGVASQEDAMVATEEIYESDDETTNEEKAVEDALTTTTEEESVVDELLENANKESDSANETESEEAEGVSLEEQAVKTGFVQQGGRTYYYQNGKKVTGQKKIGGHWYMFDKNTGSMKTGFVRIPSQNKTVYYDSKGRMVYGQKKIGGYWYNFQKGSGKMLTGFVKIASQNKTVYYDSNGRMLYGQKKIGGYWYNFKKGSGAMQTGFVKIPSQNKTVYYDSNGRMVYGQKKIGDYWYNFKHGTGAMQTGFVYIQGQKKTVYYDANGRMQYGQKKIGGYWYMFRSGNGAMVTGWYNHTKSTNKAGDKRVYYNGKGRMLYGRQTIGGKVYVFDKESGALLEDIEENKKAKSAYDQLIASKRKSSSSIAKKYIDITGDGINEALMICDSKSDSTMACFYVYSYSGGRLSCLLQEEGKHRNMPAEIIAYPGAKALVTYGYFDGHEQYGYYALKSGMYNMMAGRSRYSKKVGGEYDGPWSYSSRSGSLTKSQFDSMVNPLLIGPKKSFSIYN